MSIEFEIEGEKYTYYSNDGDWYITGDGLADKVVKLRRMIDDVQGEEYDDGALLKYIYTARGDLNQVAGEIWAEKAMKLTKTHYNFSSDGATFSLGDVVERALKNSRYYMSKRKSRTSRWIKDPVERTDDTQL